MATLNSNKPERGRVTKAVQRGRPQVTTIRLEDAVQNGLRFLEAHGGVKRPLNKWVNVALAELIERQAATLENELEQALRNIKAYRKTDPGHKRAIKAFIDAEVAGAAADPMEGSREPRPAGPAVSMVREMLRD
ncbi:MAG: hypothetical protein A3H35_04730 [Betaproteobacteria bacterium RIFCSPLOWO2_02_FULL_62_17]|nr:MAG: hypothetical protein A3H35_04730 [Betaproteobacteria bacterium RIFCSPLOWO2_02_FULL_62_17]